MTGWDGHRPVFPAENVDDLSGFLATRLNGGSGADVLQRIKPSVCRTRIYVLCMRVGGTP